MKKIFVIGSVLSGLVLGAVYFPPVPRALGSGNRCCVADSQYGPCNGCVNISTNPPEYVHAGEHTVNRCVTTSFAATCTEANKICFTLTNATVYSNASCTIVVGTTNITRTVPQCDGMDDPCGGT